MGRSSSTIIPFPAGGWNARDPYDAMPPSDCILMKNIIPRGSYGELRKGTALHSELDFGVITAVETVIGFKTSSGTQKLLATTEDSGDLWDGTNDPGVNLATGLTNREFQHTIISDKLILVNGADTPRQYDGTTLSTATYTGTGLTSTDLIDVTTYKNRLYFIEKDSTAFWYGGLNAVTGALTKFDLGTIIKQGGKLEWISSWTGSTGLGVEDFLAIMTSEGELILYSGNDPAQNWAIAARFYVGRPMHRRAKEHVGSDLWFLTTQGCISLTNLLQSGGSFTPVTNKVQDAYRDEVETNGPGTLGWDVFYYPAQKLVFVNTPNRRQLVLNKETGAWCEFDIEAIQWAHFNDKVYVGLLSTAAYGTLVEFNVGNKDFRYFGGSSSKAIRGQLRFAFNYLGMPERNKFISALRPMMQGDSVATFDVDIDADFQQSDFGTPSAYTGSNGDQYIRKVYTRAKYGRAFSIKLQGSYSDAPFKLYSVQAVYEPSREVM